MVDFESKFGDFLLELRLECLVPDGVADSNSEVNWTLQHGKFSVDSNHCKSFVKQKNFLEQGCFEDERLFLNQESEFVLFEKDLSAKIINKR